MKLTLKSCSPRNTSTQDSDRNDAEKETDEGENKADLDKLDCLDSVLEELQKIELTEAD